MSISGINIGTTKVGTVVDADATALINRMIAAGETPTTARQNAINSCILQLKDNGLFSTTFDVLVVTKGHGAASTKMNWIKDSSNAIGVANGGTLTFTVDAGYHSDGSKSYISTQYTPSIDGVLFGSTNCSFIVKSSGSLGTPGNRMHGGYGTRGIFMDMSGYSAANQVGDVQWFNRLIGYQLVGRNSSLGTQQFGINNTSGWQPNGELTSGISNGELNIFRLNSNGTGSYYCSNSEIVELYAVGGAFTPARFYIFQSIMNNYFATF